VTSASRRLQTLKVARRRTIERCASFPCRNIDASCIEKLVDCLVRQRPERALSSEQGQGVLVVCGYLALRISNGKHAFGGEVSDCPQWLLYNGFQ
jgi:hypothetical protein